MRAMVLEKPKPTQTVLDKEIMSLPDRDEIVPPSLSKAGSVASAKADSLVLNQWSKPRVMEGDVMPTFDNIDNDVQSYWLFGVNYKF